MGVADAGVASLAAPDANARNSFMMSSPTSVRFVVINSNISFAASRFALTFTMRASSTLMRNNTLVTTTVSIARETASEAAFVISAEIMGAPPSRWTCFTHATCSCNVLAHSPNLGYEGFFTNVNTNFVCSRSINEPRATCHDGHPVVMSEVNVSMSACHFCDKACNIAPNSEVTCCEKAAASIKSAKITTARLGLRVNNSPNESPSSVRKAENADICARKAFTGGALIFEIEHLVCPPPPLPGQSGRDHKII